MHSITLPHALVLIVLLTAWFLRNRLWRAIDSRLFTWVLLFSVSQACLAQTEEIITLTTPRGSQQLYLYAAPHIQHPLNNAAVLLFNGGAGVVGLSRGIPRPGANFLVRSRAYFTARGLHVALYDPSPDIGPMRDFERMSEAHRLEVAALIADLRRRSGVEKVYLVGTSRGTVSAAYIGLHMGDAVVLTSSLFVAGGRNGYGLSGFDYKALNKPLLFVHHVDDACAYTPHSEAKKLGNTYPLITVLGGENFTGDPCEPWGAHGFRGREKATVNAIVDWLESGKVSPPIE